MRKNKPLSSGRFKELAANSSSPPFYTEHSEWLETITQISFPDTPQRSLRDDRDVRTTIKNKNAGDEDVGFRPITFRLQQVGEIRAPRVHCSRVNDERTDEVENAYVGTYKQSVTGS